MAYQQILGAAYSTTEEQGAMTETTLQRDLQKMPAIMAALRKQAESGEVAMLTEPEKTSDLPEIERWGQKISDNYSHLVVMGTGGSSLGAQTLTAIKASRFMPSGMNIHYADNTDPDTMEQLLGQLPLADSFFLAVSKSGNTVETLSQFMLVLQALEANSQPVAEQCLAITMPGDRPLRKLAEVRNIPVLDHDPSIGGRFSVLSNVGLIPAAAAGLDVVALRRGAKQVMQQCWETPQTAQPSYGAALQLQSMQLGRNISVLMPYCDRLAFIGNWYQQLWAESLGKDGKGSTPARALGAVDQHSQLQLYLDGPKDKLITLLMLDHAGQGAKITGKLAAEAGMDYLSDHALGDVIASQQQATLQTLKNNGVPTRAFMLDGLEEETIGALLQHFMMETAITAGLMGIDAFNQPAVEESKQLTREGLAA